MAAAALRALALFRERAGDGAVAETLHREAADRGDPGALRRLASLWERTGDRAGAERLIRFGLTDQGEPAGYVP